MPPTPARVPVPRRQPRKTSLATLLALYALATGGQALAPASALAVDDNGPKCKPVEGVTDFGHTADGVACLLDSALPSGPTGSSGGGWGDFEKVWVESGGPPHECLLKVYRCPIAKARPPRELPGHRREGPVRGGRTGAAPKKATPRVTVEELREKCWNLTSAWIYGERVSPYPSLIEKAAKELEEADKRLTEAIRAFSTLEKSGTAHPDELAAAEEIWRNRGREEQAVRETISDLRHRANQATRREIERCREKYGERPIPPSVPKPAPPKGG